MGIGESRYDERPHNTIVVFYDRAADGLEDIRVEVADFESSWGAITFCARSVEKVVAPS